MSTLDSLEGLEDRVGGLEITLSEGQSILVEDHLNLGDDLMDCVLDTIIW
mgnify:CR=1 FL=1